MVDMETFIAQLALPEHVLQGVSEQPDDENAEGRTYFWHLGNMMDFENVGFSKTVDTTKYLSCADCDAGPIGYHDTQSDPKEFLVNVRRARYQFQTVACLFLFLKNILYTTCTIRNCLY